MLSIWRFSLLRRLVAAMVQAGCRESQCGLHMFHITCLLIFSECLTFKDYTWTYIAVGGVDKTPRVMQRLHVL